MRNLLIVSKVTLREFCDPTQLRYLGLVAETGGFASPPRSGFAKDHAAI